MANVREKELTVVTTACTCGCCGPNREEATRQRSDGASIVATVSHKTQAEQHAETCGCGCEGSGCTCGCPCCG